MTFNTEIMPRQTAYEMVEAYNNACKVITEAYTMLADAEKSLNYTFGRYTNYGDLSVVTRDNWWQASKPEEHINKIIASIKKSVWYKIIGVLEIDKVTSTKRYEEIQKNLESGNLPEITIESIFDVLMSFVQNQDEIYYELVKEAFDLLHPNRYYNKGYKTNDKNDKGISKRVILPYKVEHNYSRGFRVKYNYEQDLRVIDRVFHLLDGKGIPEGYKSPLIDAINLTDDTGLGETEYFKFRACNNMNLHLEFKRLDLLHELSRIANGNRVRSGN